MARRQQEGIEEEEKEEEEKEEEEGGYWGKGRKRNKGKIVPGFPISYYIRWGKRKLAWKVKVRKR